MVVEGLLELVGGVAERAGVRAQRQVRARVLAQRARGAEGARAAAAGAGVRAPRAAAVRRHVRRQLVGRELFAADLAHVRFYAWNGGSMYSPEEKLSASTPATKKDSKIKPSLDDNLLRYRCTLTPIRPYGAELCGPASGRF